MRKRAPFFMKKLKRKKSKRDPDLEAFNEMLLNIFRAKAKVKRKAKRKKRKEELVKMMEEFEKELHLLEEEEKEENRGLVWPKSAKLLAKEKENLWEDFEESDTVLDCEDEYA